MDQILFSRFKLVLFFLGIMIFILFGVYSINYYREKSLDATRFAQMAVIQSAMNRIYTDTANYSLGELCGVGSLLKTENCVLALSGYINDQSILSDPSNTNLLCTAQNCGIRQCDFTIGSEFNKEGYKIYFNLQKGFGGVGPGCHYLDQNGIH